jgi:hypothetical protein
VFDFIIVLVIIPLILIHSLLARLLLLSQVLFFLVGPYS